MKRLNLILVFLCAALAANAQTSNYTFTKTTATYSNLPATKTVIHDTWTNPFSNIVVSFGLDIDFFGVLTDHQDFRPTYRGQLIFDPYFTSGNLIVSAMGAESYGVVGGTPSELSYVIEGSAPNRIMKVEYKRIGFVTESSHQSWVNFQIWLYEAGDIIEMRYGPSSIQNTSAYPEDIGIFFEDLSTVHASIELLGNPASPTVGTGQTVDGVHILGVPAANTVYRFVPTTTAVNDIKQTPENITAAYDNEKRQIIVAADSRNTTFNCEIYTLAGQKVFAYSATGELKIPANSLSEGLYIVKTSTSKGIISKKIVIN